MKSLSLIHTTWVGSLYSGADETGVIRSVRMTQEAVTAFFWRKLVLSTMRFLSSYCLSLQFDFLFPHISFRTLYRQIVSVCFSVCLLMHCKTLYSEDLFVNVLIKCCFQSPHIFTHVRYVSDL
jgi:hypothetical protein